MLYTLDTNAVTAVMKANSGVLSKVLQTTTQGHDIYLNAITYFEILRGLSQQEHKRKLLIFDGLNKKYGMLDLNLDALNEAITIYRHLRFQGTLLEDADILLAGIAVAHDAVLVTRNTRHFNRIPRLKLENWEA
jgi:tRNA(fMet)-specific endonuclease VapC